MSSQVVAFERGVIKPVECYKEGWALIKDQYWLFVGICAAGMLIGTIAPFGILLGPMICGIHLALLATMRKQEIKFDILFKGFDFFVQSLIATLLQMIPMLIIIVPVYVISFAFVVVLMEAGKRGSDAGLAAAVAAFVGIVLVIMVIAILISMMFLFAYPLIADRNMTGLDACKLSIKAVFANLGGLIGLVLISMVVNLLGALLCYVGAFFVLPLYFAATAVAYGKIFGVAAVQQPMAPYFTPPPIA